ncbi:sugar ABC transporter permease [Nocardioides gansuensis]|uniref:Sugar ABC transporter permease n=1 Tax=Nocardioides gansuensis TaxID=2138300 RepID=A0A2T8FEG7_9ACTN|nr:sugar ABC transporter permease [Nocardioides gansuensis]PVG84108.1 sugar ABC transporter permease [Nocardioides gansuensis]
MSVSEPGQVTTLPRPTRAEHGRRPGKGSRIDDRRFALLLMIPAALFMLAFVAWPLVKLVVDSFFEISPIAGGPRTFVGLDNYVDVLGSSAFQAAAARTLGYTTLVVTFEFVLGLAAALLFNSLGNRSRILRTAFLYPLMIAPIVAGLLWRFLLIDNFGIVNELLFRLGILNDRNDIGWLSDSSIALFAVAVPDIWLTTSFMTLVLFAGLQNIPGDIIEAARIDGAGPVSTLFRIILPLLRPVIAVALVVRGVDAAKAFDIILIQTGGGPQNSTETLSLLIYQTMVRFGEPGTASAMGTLYLVAMLVVAVVAVGLIWRPGGRQA